MNHLSEEQLVLHYYGEEGDSPEAGRHLDECGDCRAVYASLQRVLNDVASDPVPERGPGYEAEVWRKIEARLPVHRRRWLTAAPSWRWAFASAAIAALLAVAFLAGRYYPVRPAAPVQSAADPQARERVLRSQSAIISIAPRWS